MFFKGIVIIVLRGRLLMSTPKSAEEIRKLELSLEELIPKFTGRLQLIREDLKSLINDIDNLKNYIGKRRQQLNEYTREISDLTNDLETFKIEIDQIQKEKENLQKELDNVNTENSSLQTKLTKNKTDLETLIKENNGLNETLKSLEKDLTMIETINNELRPKYEARMKLVTQEFEKLTNEKNLITNKFEAIRILCRKDYIQSPEVGLIKFLAMKPSSTSKLTEIKAALGIDETTLKRVLSGLEKRKVLDFNEAKDEITILTKIDLFKLEV